jgi:glycosyltransferase involved in cell wall biosynthesis
MKVLVVYHAAAMQNPRAIFKVLGETDGLSLTVVAPQKLAVERVYNQDGWLELSKPEESNGYQLVPVPLRDPRDSWRGFDPDGLKRVISATKPNIIHVLDEPVSGYLFQVAWLRLTASPRSRVLFYGFENRPIHLGRRGRLKWHPTWRQMAGGVAANTETLENVKRAGFPPQRPLERIFWGISTDVFRPLESAGLKARLQLSGDQIVGYVGRLVPEKGLHVLLAAMKRLPSRVECVIIGDGPMRAELELWSSLPELRGRIHMIDPVSPEDLVNYLNCMDALALPSLTAAHWKEQYGRIIAEAMSCGVPVVGSDSGAIPEVIGSAGIVVPEGDAAALSEKLAVLLASREQRRQLGELGRERAEQQLSTRAMSASLKRFYDRII